MTPRGHATALGWAAWFAVAAPGCARDAPAHGRGGPPDDVALLTVDTTSVDAPLELPAQLYVEHDAVVYARASGIVESVYVDLGARVAEGQLLAQLERADQEIALAQADEAYRTTEPQVLRQRELAKTQAISAADLEQAELAFQRATLARRQAQRNYDLTRVIAPFAGVVTARAVRARRLVNAGDSLFRVSALGPLRVSVHVPEGATAGIRPGASGAVVGVDGRMAPATVTRASPAVDAASGTREFVLQVTRGSRLRPGAAVTVLIGTQRRRVLAVPRTALTEQGYVVVWENGRAVLRAVSLGAALPDGRVEVVSGLAPGERVLRAVP